MSVTDQSMGQNSLQTRFVTKGKNAKGEPYDIRHSLFLEFDPQDDKIKRGVEYLESGEPFRVLCGICARLGSMR